MVNSTLNHRVFIYLFYLFIFRIFASKPECHPKQDVMQEEQSSITSKAACTPVSPGEVTLSSLPQLVSS